MTNNKNDSEPFERIDKYREDLEGDIIDTTKDYNTIVTYLAAGSLGLFLTINEKFFHLIESRFFWIFVASVTLLFTTLILYLINVAYDTTVQRTLRNKTNEKIKRGDYDTDDLDSYWKKVDTFSKRMMYFRMCTVIAGIAAEIIFIIVNMDAGKIEENKKPEIKIEMPSVKDSTKIIIDTSKGSIQIKFLNQ